MPRQIYLAHLATHMPVEIGDIVTPPGLQPGVVSELDEDEIALRYVNGTMRSHPRAVGVVWMDESYIRPRPDGPVHHGGTPELVFLDTPEDVEAALRRTLEVKTQQTAINSPSS